MKHITYIILFSLVFSCSNNNDINYTLTLDNDGITVEVFDTTVKDENRFNFNNKIFTVGTKFIYNYEFISKDGDSLLINVKNNNWTFIPKNNSDSTTITRIDLDVKNGLKPIIDQLPDYNQTIISYTLKPLPYYNLTGVVENEANIWIHPPRAYLFEILELNPFPYVKYPLKVGEKWEWTLKIGGQWSDPRWKVWEGNITNNYNYEITDNLDLETKFGKVRCYIIYATAKSELGITKLRAVFNEKLGFIELNYQNIDNSIINLNLTDKIDKNGV